MSAAEDARLADVLAEVERLQGLADAYKRTADDVAAVGERAFAERDAARASLAAVAALADEWEEADGNGLDSAVQSIRLEVAVNRLRAVLADHADTLASVKADAWDEGHIAAFGDRNRNPYRTTEADR